MEVISSEQRMRRHQCTIDSKSLEKLVVEAVAASVEAGHVNLRMGGVSYKVTFEDEHGSLVDADLKAKVEIIEEMTYRAVSS